MNDEGRNQKNENQGPGFPFKTLGEKAEKAKNPGKYKGLKLLRISVISNECIELPLPPSFLKTVLVVFFPVTRDHMEQSFRKGMKKFFF